MDQRADKRLLNKSAYHYELYGEEFRTVVNQSTNVDYLLFIRENAKKIDTSKMEVLNRRINTLAKERFGHQLTLGIDYRYLPLEMATNTYTTKQVFPELLKICTIYPRAVIEYMNFFMQPCVYPIFIYEDKLMVHEDSNIFLYPLDEKKNLYEPSFLPIKIQEHCQKHNLDYQSHEVLFSYDMRDYHEYQFKILIVIMIRLNNKPDLKVITKENLTMLEEKILKIIKKEYK